MIQKNTNPEMYFLAHIHKNINNKKKPSVVTRSAIFLE